MSLTPEQQANVDLGLSVLTSAAPALGPNGIAIAALITAATSALKAASASGTDVTDAELQALFDQYALNEADDLAAQDAERQRLAGKQP